MEPSRSLAQVSRRLVSNRTTVRQQRCNGCLKDSAHVLAAIGKENRDCGAFSESALGHDPPAVRLYEMLHYGEAESRAPALPPACLSDAVKPREDARKMLSCACLSGVADAHPPAGIMIRRADANAAVGGVADRIVDQVGNALTERCGVSFHRPKRLGN